MAAPPGTASSSTMSDFETARALGQGSFGSVLKVIRRADGQEYAMKRVPLSQMGEREVSDALNECRVLASVRPATSERARASPRNDVPRRVRAAAFLESAPGRRRGRRGHGSSTQDDSARARGGGGGVETKQRSGGGVSAWRACVCV
jgi:hypothetical protein